MILKDTSRDLIYQFQKTVLEGRTITIKCVDEASLGKFHEWQRSDEVFDRAEQEETGKAE